MITEATVEEQAKEFERIIKTRKEQLIKAKQPKKIRVKKKFCYNVRCSRYREYMPYDKVNRRCVKCNDKLRTETFEEYPR